MYVGDCAEDYDREAFSGEGHFRCKVSPGTRVPITLPSASGIVIWDKKEPRKETYTSGLIKKDKSNGKCQYVRALFKDWLEKVCAIGVLGIFFLMFCGFVLCYLFVLGRLGFLF